MIGYFLLFITFLTAALQEEKLFKKTFKSRPKIIFISLGIATFLTFVKQYNDSIIEGVNTELISVNSEWNKQENSYYDNLRLDNNTRKILNGLGEAIGKYSLGYDSAKNEISALKRLIKDSANRKTTIIQAESPTVSFEELHGIKLDYKRNDTVRYLVSVNSYSASAIVKDLLCMLCYLTIL